jgi:hypothetical protein
VFYELQSDHMDRVWRNIRAGCFIYGDILLQKDGFAVFYKIAVSAGSGGHRRVCYACRYVIRG